ncbi:MAG: DUF4203 domain-containing protein [Eubacterium sp.]|nr:DUF4203 domain-containing protein [Eubacterium sp.]
MNLTDIFSNFSESVSAFLQIGSVIAALTQCFLGFRLIKFWSSFAGFVIGFILGIRLSMSGVLPEDAAWAMPLVIAAGIGILLAVFAYKLVKVGIFLFCGAVAWQALSVALQTSSAAGIKRYLFLVLQVAAFLLAGYLSMKFTRAAIIIITSVGGAWTAAHGLETLLPKYLPDDLHVLGLFVLLAAAGMLIQFLTSRE